MGMCVQTLRRVVGRLRNVADDVELHVRHSDRRKEADQTRPPLIAAVRAVVGCALGLLGHDDQVGPESVDLRCCKRVPLVALMKLAAGGPEVPRVVHG